MIVLGADMHKSSHTIAAVAATNGELLGEKTIQVGERGFAAALGWARGLGAERVWALEDCRHVSGSFERFLLVHGERVVRVATRLMAGAQRFTSDAKLARAGGIAPIPVSSGKTNRHRLDRGGNRQINTAIHRVAATRARCHPETRAYIERKTPAPTINHLT